VPLADLASHPEHVALLEQWMRSYGPEELFDDEGEFRPSSASSRPKGERRMSANPHANGGLCCQDLHLPDFRDYAVEVQRRGRHRRATRALGDFLRDTMKLNLEAANFRVSRLTSSRRTASADSRRDGQVLGGRDRSWDTTSLQTGASWRS